MRGCAAVLTLLMAAIVAPLGCAADDAELDLFSPEAASDAGNDGAGGGTTTGLSCQTADDCTDSDERICEPTSLTCVGCLADSDCSSGESPRCLLPDRVCGECTSDADCTDPDKPGCVLGEHRCRECSSDAHCATGQICDASGDCR